MKKIICIALMALCTASAWSQSGTNSPYSQYGLGSLTDYSNGFNRGMNGLGLGFHEHNQLNVVNPASYAYLDSLSFFFDIGASGQVTNFKEGGRKLNANNAALDYVTAGFRLARHLGLSFGLIPYTNVGYSYANTTTISKVDDGTKTTTSNSYSGDGGLHEVYLGMGYRPFKGFSFGFNFGYLWGDLNHYVVNSYSETAINTLSKYYTATVQNYKLDLGLQYTAKLGKKDEVTLGLTYTLGHKLNTDADCQVISSNSVTSVNDTATYTAMNAYEMPSQYAAGLMWKHNNQWRVGVDYSMQKWSSVVAPELVASGNQPSYVVRKDMFNDRHKVTIGGEYVNDETSRNFFKRLRIRAGASYASSYLKINGQDGPKEYSVSAGFGIPIVNGYNNRSILNVSGQWVRQDATSFIKENTFRINIGLTFNEKWFDKWKMD